jgi:hypothetical protein
MERQLTGRRANPVRYASSVEWLRNLVKRFVPASMLVRYRRRRARVRFLKRLGAELYDQSSPLGPQDVEERIAARRSGFYERLITDVLERTEIIVQALDRRIEGVAARHGEELRQLRQEVESLRETVLELQTSLAERHERSSSSLPTSTGRAE